MSGIWVTVALGACFGLAMTAAWHFGVGSAPTLESLLDRIDPVSYTHLRAHET